MCHPTGPEGVLSHSKRSPWEVCTGLPCLPSLLAFQPSPGTGALGLGQRLCQGSPSPCAATRVAPNYSCPLPFVRPGKHRSSNQGTLIDLAELDAPSSLSPVLAPAPCPSGIPVLPPPPQASGPGRSHSSSQAEAPPGPSSTGHTLSLLDEELLCLGASWGWKGLLVGPVGKLGAWEREEV